MSVAVSNRDVRDLRIGLLWHSLNSGNLGVGALTLANMAIARSVAEAQGYRPHFVVMGMRDSEPPSDDFRGIDNYPIDTRTMLSPKGFWREAGRVDCVLDIGAGDSFAEIYGPKRFAFMWLSKWLIARRGVPLLLSPQTIGPFTKPAYRRLAAVVMRGAAAVVARDEQSLAAARAIAPGANVLLSADVAFELPFVDRSAERATRGRQKLLRVGINASGLLFHEAETGQNRFGLSMDYAKFTRALITAVQARGDAEVHLITHATSDRDPTDDDRALADRLAAEFPDTIRAPDFAGPSQAKSYISSLDFLVAGRMHACIGAFSAGTPVVPVAYSRKFDGLFGMLGYDRMLPVRGYDDTGAVAFVLDALDRRAELAATAARGMEKVTGLLANYRAALRDLFARTASRTA